MSGKFQSLSVPANKVLFREGDKGDCAYAVEAGTVEITVERDGKPVSVAMLGPGEILGEMAMISPGLRSATATTVTGCKLLRIEAQQFQRRIDALDPVMRMTIDVILARFRSTLKRIESAPPALRELALQPMRHRAEAISNLRLESEIATAIREQQFVPYYQAIVCLQTGQLAGFEALLRWNHPERGTLTPNAFIPMAEQSDLISQVTCNCLRLVASDLHEMRLACLKNIDNVSPIFVSVNVTGRDLDKPGFVQEVADIFTTDGLSADMLKLEITESSLMTDLDRVSSVLTELGTLGFGIAIDDFGTGYSSMSHLARLPISTLKVDRSFVNAISECRQNRKIVACILRLAKELDIPVISEGIETADDAAYLANRKCEFGQGYHYSQPMAVSEALGKIETWIASPPATLNVMSEQADEEQAAKGQMSKHRAA